MIEILSFSLSPGEDDTFSAGSNHVGNMRPGGFDCLLGLPAVGALSWHESFRTNWSCQASSHPKNEDRVLWLPVDGTETRALGHVVQLYVHIDRRSEILLFSGAF